MSFDPDIAAVRTRIAQARTERATEQAAGNDRKYIAACLRLKGLEMELDRLREQNARSAARAGRP